MSNRLEGKEFYVVTKDGDHSYWVTEHEPGKDGKEEGKIELVDTLGNTAIWERDENVVEITDEEYTELLNMDFHVDGNTNESQKIYEARIDEMIEQKK